MCISYMYLHVHVLLLAGGGRGCIHVLHVVYHIARNFRGRKFLRIGEKYDFHRENFCELLAFAMSKDTTPPNFVEKVSLIATKPGNSRKFISLESFMLYGTLRDHKPNREKPWG